MRKLILVGGGGHCKSVIDTVRRLQRYDEVVIVDAAYPDCRKVLDVVAVGDDAALPELKKAGFDEAFVSVGSVKSTALRRSLYRQLKEYGFSLPAIVDPSACVSPYARLAEGVFVAKGAVVNADAKIGRMAIVNTRAVVEHDCVVGDFAHVAVGAVLCGGVSVGSDVLIGAGATVIQGIGIGDGAIVGAGSTVVRGVRAGQNVKGLVK